ncbi:Tetraketide alpha-pyrone reductase 2 [Bienertia sinuspersici]
MPEYCVTGGTGFITSYLVKSLLERGYTANLIEPSIKGTLNVLISCIEATTVKRVVYTSSCSKIRYREDIQHISPLNESHWSDPDYCKRHNVRSIYLINTITKEEILSLYYIQILVYNQHVSFVLLPCKLWYAYAKTLAEQSAWQITKESGLDLVVVNPSFVISPLLGIIKGAIGEYPNQEIGFVHIDDVVAAHILAMEKSEASGRLVCSCSVSHWSRIIDMLKPKYQFYPYENKCGPKKGHDQPHSMDTSKIEQLGFPSFKTIPQMFDDCIKSFQEKGFL